MNKRRMALLFSLICIFTARATAQNRSQQQAYRSPPPPPPPAPRQQPSYTAPGNNNRQPGSSTPGYRSPSFAPPPPSRNGSSGSLNGEGRTGLGSGNLNAGAGQTARERNSFKLNSPANDRMPGTPPPRSLFKGPQPQALGAPRDRFQAGSAAPVPNLGKGQNFGTQVKPQVGSGTATTGGTSGLRDRFKVAATGGDRSGPGSGGGGGSGGGPPSHSPGGLSSRFNAAAGKGSGRIDGTKTLIPEVHPEWTDEFGGVASGAGKKIANEERRKKGNRIHARALEPKP